VCRGAALFACDSGMWSRRGTDPRLVCRPVEYWYAICAWLIVAGISSCFWRRADTRVVLSVARASSWVPALRFRSVPYLHQVRWLKFAFPHTTSAGLTSTPIRCAHFPRRWTGKVSSHTTREILVKDHVLDVRKKRKTSWNLPSYLTRSA
jgi:hypothetical protein